MTVQKQLNMPIQKITKQEIVRTALSLFHQQGYYITTMNDLAAACGLKKGSFYHYFPSKEAIAEAVVESLREYYKRKIFIQLQDSTIPLRERMYNICELQRAALSYTRGGCFFGNLVLETAHSNPPFKDNLKAFFQDWQQCLTVFFAEKYPENQAQILANRAIMLVEGAAMMARLYQDDAYLDTAFEQLQTYC